MKQYRITDWCTIYDVESTEEEDLEFGVNLVKYADHLEAVSQARADALRWVLEQIVDIEIPSCCDNCANRVVGANNERDHLRTIIEKELNQ